jgi:hypothetical protein
MALIIGNYDRQNLGDEQYKITIFQFLKKSGFNGVMTFMNINDAASKLPAKFDIVICGGGDIINSLFNEKLLKLLKNFRGPIIALSVGINDQSVITKEYLDIYNYIVLRHHDFLDEVSNVISPASVITAPDLAFLLDYQTPVIYQRKTIGVFSVNGFHLEHDIRNSLDNIKKNYEVILYSMNTSRNIEQGDYFSNVLIGPFNSYNTTDVHNMMSQIGGLDLAICVNYYAHIFCIIQGTPFVSIAVDENVKMLMKNLGFTDNVAHSGKDLQKTLDWSLNNYQTLKHHVSKVNKDCKIGIDNLRIPLGLKPYNICEVAKQCEEFLEQKIDTEEVAAHALFHTIGLKEKGIQNMLVDGINKGEDKIEDMLNWIVEGNHQEKKPYKGLRFLQTPNTFAGVHRGGWESACKTLRAIENPKGILCDLYIDSTFHWKCDELVKQGVLPYNQLWVGFIHHTDLMNYTPYNTHYLFKSELFLKSLKHCRGLVVLSENLREYVQKQVDELGFKNIIVKAVKHPTESTPKNFDFKEWLHNPTITQVGAFLRDTYAIYALKNNWARKQVLQGSNMESYIHPEKWYFVNTKKCKCDNKDNNDDDDNNDLDSDNEDNDPAAGDGNMSRPPHHHHHHRRETVMTGFMTLWAQKYGAPIFAKVCAGERCCKEGDEWPVEWISKIESIKNAFRKNYQSVRVINYLNNDEYDDLLSKTVVFVNLLDCSGCNTIVECIQRSTPMMVNKMPATVEYLGKNYPGFYDTFVSDVNPKAESYRISRIIDNNKYMVRMDKSPFSLDQFLRNVELALKDYVSVGSEVPKICNKN